LIREAIAKAIEGVELTEDQARLSMMEIMEGRATPSQIGAFLTAMRMKGETVGEISALARAMREKSVRIHPRVSGRVVDTCGTGGDGKDTFNISTTSMFVAAGAGVRIAKHGNRSVSSRCGSADVLENLGARIDLRPEEVERMMGEAGICFMFAPVFHPAMKHALGPRREMGVRTFFNILGPLTNPCDARGHVLGVYDARLTELMAGVSARLGMERVFVVHGVDGLDEISVTGPTVVSEQADGGVSTYQLEPSDLGIPVADQSELAGGDAPTNSRILVEILAGHDAGPRRDAAAVNAAAAIAASEGHGGIADAVPRAMESIENGRALKALLRFVTSSGGDAERVKLIAEEEP